LVSRCRVFRLEPLDSGHIRTLLERAVRDEVQGLGRSRADIAPDALEHLVRVADGDARIALNALEMAVQSLEPGPDGRRLVTLQAAVDAVQRRALRYDRAGDGHFDAASAFIKSMRGSDPDATVYWLARMIEAGEDPVFIARRIVIAAAEEVGNADPRALQVAVAAAYATTLIGLPEARIPLAQAAIYVACAPKSNASYIAIDAALADVRRLGQDAVPLHLRNAPHPALGQQHGHGVGYKYPHDSADHVIDQLYLPPHLAGVTYYQPSESGTEAEIRAHLKRIRELTTGSAGGTIRAEDKV
jgi:putative ATPase